MDSEKIFEELTDDSDEAEAVERRLSFNVPASADGSRQVSVCREISKVHEESVRGTLAEVIAHFQQHEPRGEFVIVLAGKK